MPADRPPGESMNRLQKTMRESEGAPEPAVAPAAAAPKKGERLSDEELHARFGVPMQGGIRVSRENRCIVLVNCAGDGMGYANEDRGADILYMGQDPDHAGVQDQEMSGNNLALSRSKDEEYAVLYFVKEDDTATFDSRVEYDSHEFEAVISGDGQHRVAVKFSLQKVGEETPSRRRDAGIEVAKEHGKAAERHAGDDGAEIDAIDSPPLTTEEIAAIEDFLAEPEPRTIPKEEFLSIVMDDKKLKEHIRSMDS